MIQNILVPTDFSAVAEHAQTYAFELAEKLGAKVHLLHVYSVPPFPDGMALSAQVVDTLAAEAQRNLKTAAQPHEGKPTLGQLFSKMGDARDWTVRVGRELPADLIVMGTHGRRGVQRLLLGSVAEALVRTAPCPVLTVHPPTPAEQAG